MRAQKDEALGRMAPAVAHDINNLLSGILGYSQLCLHDPDAGNMKLYIGEIERAANRIVSLTRVLHVFARHRPSAPERVDLGALLKDMAKFIPFLIGDRVSVITETTPSAGSARAVPALILQALVALSIEIRNMMPEGGSVVISTSDFAASGRGNSGEISSPSLVGITVTAASKGALDRQSPLLGGFIAPSTSPAETTAPEDADFHEIVHRCGGHVKILQTGDRDVEIRIGFPVDDREGSGSPSARA